MSLQTVDDYSARAAAGYILPPWRIWGELQVAATSNCMGGSSGQMSRTGDCLVLPSLPAGVTAWIPARVSVLSSSVNAGILIAKVINLGSFDIGAATTGVFTDGSAMPTQTIFGTASKSLPSGIIAEVTTALTGTQTAITVTYTNQAGTASQAAPAFGPTTASTVSSSGTIALAAGDWGVTDITAIARASSAGPTGVIKFWGIIPISFVCTPVANTYITDNLITSGVNAIRLGAGDTIKAFFMNISGTKAIDGYISFVGDN